MGSKKDGLEAFMLDKTKAFEQMQEEMYKLKQHSEETFQSVVDNATKLN